MAKSTKSESDGDFPGNIGAPAKPAMAGAEHTSPADLTKVSEANEMAAFVRTAVDAGEYTSTSEALREWRERRGFLGYSVEELRELALEGQASGPSPRPSMGDVKAEARRRFEVSPSRTM